MRAHPFLRLASLAGAIAVVPSLASAQLAGGVVVTPYIGAYTPTNQIARTGSTPQGASLTVDAKHQAAAAFGANVSYWFTDRFAIEGGGVYTSSNLKSLTTINDPSVITSATQTRNAHVWLGSAKLMMQLLPVEDAFNLRFGIGPAIISRGGSAYNANSDGQITGLTDYGAAASLCTRISFTPNVAIRLRAEDYMYYSGMGWRSAASPTENFAFDSRMQHDFIFSAGLQLFLKP
jgi:hypothetical protein